MKKMIILLIIVMTIFFIGGCHLQKSPEEIGIELFSAIKTFSSSSASEKREGAEKLAVFFSDREQGINFYINLNSKAASRGVWDWSKIEYVDYFHKEFKKNGVEYSAGCLVMKLNGKKDYKFLGIYLLNIQSNGFYKILECNDNWSRNDWSKSTKEIVVSELDVIFEDWIN